METVKGVLMVYGLRVIGAIIIFFVGRWIAQRIRDFFESLMRKKGAEETVISFTSIVIYTLLMAFIIMAVLKKIGIETTSFIAILGAAGLAIGLALQGSLANFAAGFLMMIFHPFKAGDVVECGGATGIVERIHIFTSQIKTFDNKTIIIPNGKIMGDNIINFSTKATRRVDLVVGVSYSDDIKKVKDVLQKIANSDKRVLKDPEPMIAVSELAESSVNFVVRLWVKTEDYWNVYFDTTETVKKRFDKEGICIPFPQRDLHLFETKSAS